MLLIYNTFVTNEVNPCKRITYAIRNYLDKVFLPIRSSSKGFMSKLFQFSAKVAPNSTRYRLEKREPQFVFRIEELPTEYSSRRMKIGRIYHNRVDVNCWMIIPTYFLDLWRFKILTLNEVENLAKCIFYKNALHFSAIPLHRNTLRWNRTLIDEGFIFDKSRKPSSHFWDTYDLKTLRNKALDLIKKRGFVFVYDEKEKVYEWKLERMIKIVGNRTWDDEINSWTKSKKEIYFLLKNLKINKKSRKHYFISDIDFVEEFRTRRRVTNLIERYPLPFTKSRRKIMSERRSELVQRFNDFIYQIEDFCQIPNFKYEDGDIIENDFSIDKDEIKFANINLF